MTKVTSKFLFFIIMGSNTEKSEAGAVRISGFNVTSDVEVTQSVECNQMVTGDELSVVDGNGTILFTGLRGFMPLGGSDFLIRQKDGQWVLIRKGKQIRLKKVNLQHEGLALLFDERGKLHYNQESPHYRSISA